MIIATEKERYMEVYRGYYYKAMGVKYLSMFEESQIDINPVYKAKFIDEKQIPKTKL